MYDTFEKNCVSTEKSQNYFGDQDTVLSKNQSLNLVNGIAENIFSVLEKNQGAQNPIAILLPRNNNYLASIFAIWQLGDYFIPLNLEWPIAHINKILSICR